MAALLQKLVQMVLDKKRIIGWLAAVGFLIGGMAASMTTQEFKDAVCGAPVINAPQAPVVAPAVEAK